MNNITNKLATMALSIILISLILMILELAIPDNEFVIVLDEELIDVQSGDIIFSEGDSFKSDIVRLRDNRKSKISHTGFLQQKEDGLYVTHMSIDDDMIISEPILTFIHRNKVRGYAIKRISFPIDVVRMDCILDSLVQLRIPFDNHFDMKDHSELYCTEFICYVLGMLKLTDIAEMEYDDILYPVNLMRHEHLKDIYSNIY